MIDKTKTKKAVQEEAIADLKRVKPSLDHTRSITVKMDANRYFRYNKARYETHQSGQDIMTEALDLWFAKNKY